MADVVNTNGPAMEGSAEPTELGGGGAVEEPVSLERLLATYTAWSSADVTDTARRRAHAAGEVDRAAALEAMTRDAPSPTQALAAAHELTSLLAGWRWHTVRAAREAGATWHDIAAATGTDPATARAEYAARVEQAREQARAAGFEFRDEPRYRTAAQPDPHDAQQDTDDTDDTDTTDGDSAMDHDDQPQGDEQHAESGWPDLDPTLLPTSPLAEISDRELIARAERDHAEATTSTDGDAAAAWTDLQATTLEAERRAADQPPDSVPAQVAGYINLVSEDHTGALAAEAASWRSDLDQVLPPTGADTGDRASWSPGENAARVDARMSAQTPDGDGADGVGAGFDLSRLDEVTERWGYAVFDPAAPGGVREPTSSEYAELLGQLTPTPRVQDDADRGGPSASAELAWGWPGTVEAQVDEVERRTADPTFGYDPAAEWGDATYREPRTHDEADARTAHLDGQRALHPPAPRTPMRALTEVENALSDAELDAELSHRARDGDPEPAARVADLEALRDLRSVPTREPDHETSQMTGLEAGTARYWGPEVEFEDQLFRRSLEHTVPGDAAGREQSIERAVEVARDRFWTHGLTTYPDEALALASGSTDDDPARLRDLLEQTRAQLAARDAATTGQTAQEVRDDQRREQLTRWHDDDRDAQADDADEDPLLMRCFGDPPAEDQS